MVHTVDDLQRGRESYERRGWTDAHEALSRAQNTYFEVDSGFAIGLAQTTVATA